MGVLAFPIALTRPSGFPARGVVPVNSEAEPASKKQTVRDAEAEIDRALLEQAKTGDARAFKHLVERHQHRAFGVALALVRNEEDAREVVQEAFVRVYRGLSDFHGGSSFFTWLYRIVHNLAIDVVRRPSRREIGIEVLAELEPAALPVDALPLFEDPEDHVERGQLLRSIEAALDALPAYHRGVIVMREVYGMSYEEMAETMGVSKGTIMSRLFHARKKLQAALASCYVEVFGVPASAESLPSGEE